MAQRSTWRARRPANGLAGDERAVSDVIGAILLVGITVGMMVGLSIAVLSLDGPHDRVHMEIRMSVLPGGSGWGTGDETIRLEHVGGESLRQSTSRISLDVGNTSISLANTQLDQGFADGTFSLGDVWQRTQVIAEGDEVDVLLIDDSGNAVTTRTQLTARGSGTSTGGGTGGTSGTVTYVSTATASAGTLTDVDAMKSGSAPLATAQLTESTSGGVASTSTRDPSALSASSGATNQGNVLASDDARATLASNGATIEVTGFDLPITGVTISDVVIGFEAQRGGGSGPSPEVLLSYELSGSLGTTSGTHTVSSNGDDHYTTDVSGDKIPWTITDLAGMTVLVERQSASRDVVIDHIYITVTYATPIVTDAEATFDFAGVPPASAGGDHTLQVRYRTQIETFSLQLMTGATARTCATLDSVAATMSSTAYALATCTLQGTEYNGGAPQVRIIDRDTGSLAGNIRIDYMRIDTT